MLDENQFDVPPPSEQWSSSNEWQSDQIAEKEVDVFHLESEIRLTRSRAKSLLIRHCGWVAVGLLYVGVAFLIAYVWHLIGFDCWKWIEEDNLSKMETVIFSGVSGAVIGSLVQQHLKQLFN